MFPLHNSPLRILTIGASMYQAGGYGEVSKIVSRSNLSRSSCYRYEAMFNRLVEDPSWQRSLQSSKRIRSSLMSRDEFILNYYLSGNCSTKSICTFLRLHGFGAGSGIVSTTLNNYGSCLSAIDNLPSIRNAICLSIDEIFICGHPCLVIVDHLTSYIFGMLLCDNRKKETWVACLSKLLGDGKSGSVLVSADFASAISSALSDLGLSFQGDLFHYFRYLRKALTHMWNTFERVFGQMEKAEKQYKHEQNQYKDLIVPTQIAADKLLKAQTTYQQAYQKAAESMQHYDDARYLLHCATQLFHYFDDNGQWITHKTVQDDLQTVCELLYLLPCEAMQKAAKFCLKHLSEVTQYIAQLEPHITQQQSAVLNLPNNDPKNDLFLPQVVGLIVKHLRLEQAAKNKKQQQYHQKQAQNWTADLEQYCGQQTAKDLIQQCQETIQKYHRSSSMTENANSRIKPYCNMSRGQVTQEKLNLIRHYLNHSPFLRSRCQQRKNKTPYQLLHQLTDENTITWWDSLCKQYKNKKE